MNRPSIARLFLVVNLSLVWLITGFMTSGMTSLNHRAGLARLLPLEYVLSTPVWFLCSTVYIAALGGFLVRNREDLCGWVLMFMMAIFVGLEMSIRQVFMPQLESMLAGGLLGAWLVARGIAKRSGLSAMEQDNMGHEAVAGTFGAMMVLAAGSKLHLSGLDWFDGSAHCAMMYEHELLAPSPFLGPLRSLLLEHVQFCALGAVYALGVEALGVAMIWPSLRKFYAVTVVTVFVALEVLYGIFEVSWPLMACALAWSHLGSPDRNAYLHENVGRTS